MTRRAREIETLLMTMFAALPLYLTGAVSLVPLLLFHGAMAGILARVVSGRGPELIPARVMRWIAFAYLPFYVVDAAFLSAGAIAASTHLVLFIAVYQPTESLQRENQAQRLLTATLIFIASLATSTHATVVLFVGAFAFLMLRQLMYVAHLDTVRSIEARYAEPPTTRAAAFYLCGSIAIAAILFPLLPRVRNPLVHGITGSLPGATTALSESINFNEPRVTPPDTTVVARVWMGRQARSFFAPIRLRGTLYERYWSGEWRQTIRGLREVPRSGNGYVLARPDGVASEMVIQQRPQRGKLFLPPGAVVLTGVNTLFEGPARESYYTLDDGVANLRVRVAYDVEPMRLTRIGLSGYPVTEEVAALARRIVGSETRPERRAELIEDYLISNYRYLRNPVTPGPIRSLDDFLLRDREGHCEYFAAGMVVLLNAVDVPARVAGGFYGGRFNPLTGYFTIRREDAHAWTEVWNGTQWVTYDSTPPAMRPGTEAGTAIGTYASALADSVNFFWDRYVLTFGLADQIDFFMEALAFTRRAAEALRGRLAADIREVATPQFAFLIALLVAIALFLSLFRRRRDPVLAGLTAYFAAREIELNEAMTLREALARLRERSLADASAVEPVIALYEEERFSERARGDRRLELRRRVAALRSV